MMQMQLAVIDKCAETSKKYICQIAKLLAKNKKCKKGWSDNKGKAIQMMTSR